MSAGLTQEEAVRRPNVRRQCCHEGTVPDFHAVGGNLLDTKRLQHLPLLTVKPRCS